MNEPSVSSAHENLPAIPLITEHVPPRCRSGEELLPPPPADTAAWLARPANAHAAALAAAVLHHRRSPAGPPAFRLNGVSWRQVLRLVPETGPAAGAQGEPVEVLLGPGAEAGALKASCGAAEVEALEIVPDGDGGAAVSRRDSRALSAFRSKPRLSSREWPS
jgi:hypothetical protein